MQDIDRELSTLRREERSLKRTIRRAEATEGRPPAWRPRPADVPYPPPRPPAPGVSSSVPIARPEAPFRPPSESFPPETVDDTLCDSIPSPESQAIDPVREEQRRRFAAYFGSGNVDTVHPLRHERSIARNRFILIVVAVLLVVLWLIYLFV